MGKEVLKSIKSLVANSSIIGFDIVEITTNKRTINERIYFTNMYSKKSGAIRHYTNNVLSICKKLNIDYNKYFTRDKLDNLGILPFEYSQKICELDVYNND